MRTCDAQSPKQVRWCFHMDTIWRNMKKTEEVTLNSGGILWNLIIVTQQQVWFPGSTNVNNQNRLIPDPWCGISLPWTQTFKESCSWGRVFDEPGAGMLVEQYQSQWGCSSQLSFVSVGMMCVLYSRRVWASKAVTHSMWYFTSLLKSVQIQISLWQAFPLEWEVQKYSMVWIDCSTINIPMNEKVKSSW